MSYLTLIHAAFISLCLIQGVYAQAQRAPTIDPVLTVPPVSLAPEVYFVNLHDGDVLKSPFRVIFGLSRLGLAPVGTNKLGTGHHHLLIDTALPLDLKKSIPFSDKYQHFSEGESEAIIELKPGKHTLQLLFADAEHRPFVKVKSGNSFVLYSKQITIEVRP